MRFRAGLRAARIAAEARLLLSLRIGKLAPVNSQADFYPKAMLDRIGPAKCSAVSPVLSI